jgi:hypothetical protein
MDAIKGLIAALYVTAVAGLLLAAVLWLRGARTELVWVALLFSVLIALQAFGFQIERRRWP